MEEVLDYLEEEGDGPLQLSLIFIASGRADFNEVTGGGLPEEEADGFKGSV